MWFLCFYIWIILNVYVITSRGQTLSTMINNNLFLLELFYKMNAVTDY